MIGYEGLQKGPILVHFTPLGWLTVDHIIERIQMVLQSNTTCRMTDPLNIRITRTKAIVGGVLPLRPTLSEKPNLVKPRNADDYSCLPRAVALGQAWSRIKVDYKRWRNMCRYETVEVRTDMHPLCNLQAYIMTFILFPLIMLGRMQQCLVWTRCCK